MTNDYRIIKKLITHPTGHDQHCHYTVRVGDYCICDGSTPKEAVHSVKFTVQKSIYSVHLGATHWLNVKVFDTLKEARKFKRSLELTDGIVVE